MMTASSTASQLMMHTTTHIIIDCYPSKADQHIPECTILVVKCVLRCIFIHIRHRPRIRIIRILWILTILKSREFLRILRRQRIIKIHSLSWSILEIFPQTFSNNFAHSYSSWAVATRVSRQAQCIIHWTCASSIVVGTWMGRPPRKTSTAYLRPIYRRQCWGTISIHTHKSLATPPKWIKEYEISRYQIRLLLFRALQNFHPF